MIGITKGVLTSIEVVRINNRTKVVCKCVCGNIKNVELHYFKTRVQAKCCCDISELRSKMGKMGRKYASFNNRIYQIWENMKQRCYNPKAKNYKNYGGRGIIVCDEWLDFSPFEKWSLNNGYADNLTLDRKENDKNYSPDNCRWITNFEQQSNSRKNVWVTYNGETLTISQWSRKVGVHRSLISHRLKAGHPVEKALSAW
jgi:hypothetical protein